MKTAIPSLVRRIEPADWQLYRELRLNALKLAPDAFGSRYEDAIRLSDQDWKDRAQKFSHGNQAVLFIAFLGEQAAGIIGGFKEGDTPLRMIQMWVEPNSRGTGVSEELVDSLKAWAYREGYREIALSVTESNEPAIRLYERTGFKKMRPATMSDRHMEFDMLFKFSL